MMRFPLSLLAAGLLSLAACNNAAETTTTKTGEPMTDMTAETDNMNDNMAADMNGNPDAMANPNGPTAPHATDEEFMKSAAHSDQNEIQLSQMALQKA